MASTAMFGNFFPTNDMLRFLSDAQKYATAGFTRGAAHR
jgi:hypothetical protein